MNFFEHQEQARKRTGRLVVLYGVAVVLIVVAIYAVLMAIFFKATGQSPDESAPPFMWWNPEVFLWVTVGAIVILGGGTLYKIKQLAGGGAVVAEMLGGVPIASNTRDFNERRILNVVEEMALAAGTPVPPVYIMPNEAGINAFAAGFTPQDAVIGVTRGCATLLTRDELQGVIAHEFSHILNGDMRLNIRLMGVLHGILVIALLGYWVFRIAIRSGHSGGSSSSSRGGKKGGGAIAFILLGLGLMVIGYIGVFFGKLIKSAVSRQREFLADASSVQFTRNPASIAGALKKIGGFTAGSRLASPNAEEASHFFFANGLRGSFLNLMATHPPLDERIRRIDPSFTGEFPGSDTVVAAKPTGDDSAVGRMSEFAGAAGGPRIPSTTKKIPFTPAKMTNQVGAPGMAHLQYAAELMARIPDALRQAIHEPVGAQAAAYALLLSRREDIAANQRAHLAKNAPSGVYLALAAQLPAVQATPTAARLSLITLALPALRQMPPAGYATFRENIFFLASADMEIDLFEYALLHMLARHLDPVFTKVKPAAVRHHHLGEIAAPCRTMLATMAYFGHADDAKAAESFAMGLAQLPGVDDVPMQPRNTCSLESFDKALEQLAEAAPMLKKQIIAACTACCAADGFLSVEEGEMLRAVADSLDCPIPPFLDQAA